MTFEEARKNPLFNTLEKGLRLRMYGEGAGLSWQDFDREAEIALREYVDMDEVVVWDGKGSIEFLATHSHVHDLKGKCIKRRYFPECN